MSLRRVARRPVRCPQAGLPTFPTGGISLLSTRGEKICWIKEISWIKVSRQKRRVEVALDRPNATRTLVPALPQQLGHVLAAAMTVLGEFAAARRNFHQGAARACNGAFQHL